MDNHLPKSSKLTTTKTAKLCFTYSLAITFWLCFRWLFFDQLWPLAIINTAIFFFFIPLPLLLLMALTQRHKSAIISLILPVAIFLVLWGELFFPSFNQPPGNSAQQIKAMTYNVLFSNQSSAALAQSILSASPDVIGFQELTPQTKQSLESSLSEIYPYFAYNALDRQGVGLLSRYPILSEKEFSFPPKNQRALHAVVNWEGQPVHIIVVHFSANNFFDNPLAQLPQLASERFEQRANQMTNLEEELAMIDEPIILMCDCNFTNTSEAYSRLNQILNDSYRSAGWGFGHTLAPPSIPLRLQRIDYVWHSDDFIPVDAFVGLPGGSDHHPVISTLAFLGQD